MFESLESRQLMSVSLVGEMNVVGTSAADTIVLSKSPYMAPTATGTRVGYAVAVNVNGSVSKFFLSDVTQINVNSGGGNDLIYVSDVGYGRLSTPINVDAGSGDDVVMSGDGNDTLFGGTGKDWLGGAGGNDWLYGDADESTDTLSGGSGTDLFFMPVTADRTGLDGGSHDYTLTHTVDEDIIIDREVLEYVVAVS